MFNNTKIYIYLKVHTLLTLFYISTLPTTQRNMYGDLFLCFNHYNLNYYYVKKDCVGTCSIFLMKLLHSSIVCVLKKNIDFKSIIVLL